ncbi:MAG: methionyl-tRNA formyltransferase [bacterium]|nr:methionyl-tRNA formyltransferase [bacterium]
MIREVDLFIMNAKGYSVLKALHANNLGNIITNVVSSEDKSVQKDFYLEIRAFAEKHGYNFHNRKDFKPSRSERYKIAIGWRWLLSDFKNLIVLHDSLLPRYRGFAPLVNALINKEQTVGVTALYASKEYDAGPIIMQKQLPLNYPIKINTVINMISELYTQITIDLVQDIKANIVLPKAPQNEAEATYSIWRDEEDYFINWNDSSENIGRFIDAVGFPYAGAKAHLNNEVVTISNWEVFPDKNFELRHAGKILLLQEGYPVVICGKGLIKLTKITDNNGEIISINKLRSRFR